MTEHEKQGLGIWSSNGPKIAGEIVAKDGNVGIKVVYGPKSSFSFWDKAVVCTRRGGGLTNWELDCNWIRDTLCMKVTRK